MTVKMQQKKYYLEGEEHKTDKYEKTIPLSPQVHTGDVPGD